MESAKQAQVSQFSREETVVFSGTTGEYFKIWIVNVFLTLITLGIYSAWATVRKRRYFYGHTAIDGATFDYHARPQGILVGRALAVAMLGAYWAVAYFFPGFDALIILGIFGISPWLLVLAKRFSMANASYRGIRFGFEGQVSESYAVILVRGALFTLVTLGLAAPYAAYVKNRFVVNETRFGVTQFAFSGVVGGFYGIYVKALLLLISVMGLLIGFSAMMISGSGLDSDASAMGLNFWLVPLLLAAYLLVFTFVFIKTANYVLSNTRLDSIAFSANLRVSEVFWIYLTNLIAIILTVGLAVPWAQIRMARYRAAHIACRLDSRWDQFIADAQTQAAAAGQEVGEAFDMDVGLGF